MVRKSVEMSWTDLIFDMKISEFSGRFILAGKLHSYEFDLHDKFDKFRIETFHSHK
jgi:hypothetical protein